MDITGTDGVIMQVLAYNPHEDEFFIGMSREEFECIARRYNIDVETEMEKAQKEYKDKRQNEKLKEMYQTEKTPFICAVVNRSCSYIKVRPRHFPFANLWNGYSPWQKTAVREIESLELHSLG